MGRHRLVALGSSRLAVSHFLGFLVVWLTGSWCAGSDGFLVFSWCRGSMFLGELISSVPGFFFSLASWVLGVFGFFDFLIFWLLGSLDALVQCFVGSRLLCFLPSWIGFLGSEMRWLFVS